ncbi:MAG: GNAT family N-acetyltransferase [Noviherbaspirillum sp.]
MKLTEMEAAFQFVSAQDGKWPVDSIAVGDDLTISFHENEVPSFAAAEIDRLYGHLFCSLSHFQVAKDLKQASTYVVRKASVVITVFLFIRDGHEVKMINEFAPIDEAAARLFARSMFARYPSVKVVSFSKVRVELHDLPYPFQKVNCTEDIVVTLPPTVDEYHARLGKNMRRNLKRYTSTLQRDFPSYSYHVYVGDEVSEQQLRDIIELNRTRMAGKSIVSRIDEEETQWIVRFARQCGIVGVATIDGRVCGGAIGFRIGENYFMHVIAHDPAYNDYSLGILCYYETICEGIVRGGKRFHLLLGRYDYKYRLLGVTQEIAHVDIYRNHFQALLHGGRIAATAINSRVWQAKLWLLEAERRDDPGSRLATRFVRIARMLKRRVSRAH